MYETRDRVLYTAYQQQRNPINNSINNSINNPINNPINNAKVREENQKKNREIIAANPYLSTLFLTEIQVAEEAENLYTKALESLGGRSIKQVT